MKLSKLIENAPDIEIETLFTDSRQKVKNGLFFCLKGMISDGHKYVNEAIKHGAVAIVYHDDLKKYVDDIAYIQVVNVQETMVEIIHRFYDDVTKKLTIYGVTGTNGKTSISCIIKDIIDRNSKCGYIGTIGIKYDDLKFELNNTTNSLLSTVGILNDMYKTNQVACAMEVSSQGLDQHRTDGIDFDCCVFTNLTHEHIDYHGNMENYFEAKARLFQELSSDKIAIINIDDDYGKRLMNMTKARVVTYGLDEKADYQAYNLQLRKDGSVFDIKVHGIQYRVETNMVARFNISNLTAVIAALCETGYDIEDVIPCLKDIKQIDGRIEIVDEGQDFTVIIDFAHTPDGFEKIFEYAKAITDPEKKIISVFGSAGRRDSIKRPILGEIADKYCKNIILTEDDPRDESVMDICHQIASGIKGNYSIIENRENAIRQGIELANRGDTVLILGKGDDDFIPREFGYEDYIGDQIVARFAINEYVLYKGDEDEIQQIY